jgi:multidrug transporter EmrE-like cation transporter
VFWIGTITCLIIGTIMLIYGATHYESGQAHYLWKGIAMVLLGPLGVRLYCEILIVFFRINETLTEIKHALERRPEA